MKASLRQNLKTSIIFKDPVGIRFIGGHRCDLDDTKIYFSNKILRSANADVLIWLWFGFVVEFWCKNHFFSLKPEWVTKYFYATNIFPMTPCSVKASPHCALCSWSVHQPNFHYLPEIYIMDFQMRHFWFMLLLLSFWKIYYSICPDSDEWEQLVWQSSIKLLQYEAWEILIIVQW